MRDQSLLIVVCMATMALIAGRADSQPAAAEPHQPAADAQSAHSSGGPIPGLGTPKRTAGKVVETINAGAYTYVQVDDGSKRIWAAAPNFAVAVGDDVVVPAGSPMRDFHSKTLGRTFDLVYFVAAIQVAGSQTADKQVVAAHGASAKTTAAAALDTSDIEKADGGQTVAELFANRAALVGKEVVLRGKVAKFTAGIMGKNWIHVQDGTGSATTNDLTVTTSAAAAVGDTVLVRGKLNTDKDFGLGYKYDVIVEDAVVTVE